MEIHRTKDTKGVPRLKDDARVGGSVAGSARKQIERKIGRKIVSKSNFLKQQNIKKLKIFCSIILILSVVVEFFIHTHVKHIWDKIPGINALFGFITAQMKQKLGVKPNRPLADFLPTITVKAKDFATEITIFNVKDKDIHQGDSIAWEHITNNQSVRKLAYSLSVAGVLFESR